MHCRSINLKLAALTLGFGLSLAPGGQPARDDAGWNALRQRAINRPRPLIFNNDGNEPVYYCREATAEELLRLRTAPLAGSQVSSIFYCTWSSGFGLFTHHTKVGQVFNSREAMFKDNRTQEFLDKGIDPLRVMVEFARRQNIEIFWSLRMNDTHDGSSADYGPVMFRANRLKQEHPEWLIGSKAKPPKYGRWSAVDFSVDEIRELAFRYCEEICQNYDVDGIELDFFRHAFFFKCSGAGAPCGETELNQMTALIRRIRAVVENSGRKRQRPILLAVRVPDSVEYCRFIGLDIETWLKEGLLDLLVVSGYTQLNSWEYSVRLGHQYGVKVYPSLDEPRVRDDAARRLRASPATYRGRARNVWASGADGVYLFNFFDPHSVLWWELGDPKILSGLERNYFASVRGPGAMPVPHQKFIQVTTLNPGNPISIAPGKPARVEFSIGEAFAGKAGDPPIRLRLQFGGAPPAKQVRVTLNERELSDGKAAGDWLEFRLNGRSLRSGKSLLEVACFGEATQSLSLLDLCVVVGR